MSLPSLQHRAATDQAPRPDKRHTGLQAGRSAAPDPAGRAPAGRRRQQPAGQNGSAQEYRQVCFVTSRDALLLELLLRGLLSLRSIRSCSCWCRSAICRRCRCVRCCCRRPSAIPHVVRLLLSHKLVAQLAQAGLCRQARLQLCRVGQRHGALVRVGRLGMGVGWRHWSTTRALSVHLSRQRIPGSAFQHLSITHASASPPTPSQQHTLCRCSVMRTVSGPSCCAVRRTTNGGAASEAGLRCGSCKAGQPG